MHLPVLPPQQMHMAVHCVAPLDAVRANKSLPQQPQMNTQQQMHAGAVCQLCANCAR